MLKLTRTLFIMGASLAGLYSVLKSVAYHRRERDDIDVDNLYLQISHIETAKTVEDEYSKGGVRTDTGKDAAVELKLAGVYETTIKPILDQLISFIVMIFCSPIYVIIAMCIYFDDPGPVFFTQKRVGKDKHFFMCHKFRTMKISAPADVPTHQLQSPDQYITCVGKLLRRTSLDELPQIWDIFRSRMSFIGPRPALWNQEDLVAERDKYGANGIMPGLTGLAQICGRDELEIADKARIDGEYKKRLRSNGMKAFLQDCGCFFGTFKSVIRQDGVVEGGVGEIHKRDH